MSGSATATAARSSAAPALPSHNNLTRYGATAALLLLYSLLTEEGQHVGVGHRGSCAWMVPPPHPWQQQNSSTRQRIHNNEQCAH